MDYAPALVPGLPRIPDRRWAWLDVVTRRLAGAPSAPVGIDRAHASLVANRGEPAPRLRRPDLAGDVVDLAAIRGKPLLLLFWSPGCGYCQALLPYILAYEAEPDRVPMVVLSGGSVSVNEELGFASPVVLDDDRAIAQAFGVMGTPGAVLIGALGTIASEVAHGPAAVRSYVDWCRSRAVDANP